MKLLQLRAFLSRIAKNLAFIISNPNFIIYNTPLYNIPFIKTSIFFNIPFKYSFFIIFYFSFSLLSLSLSHPNYSQHCRPPHPPTHTTTTASTHHHRHQPPVKSTAITNNSREKERRKTSTSTHHIHIHHWTKKKKSTAIGPNHHQPQQEEKEKNPQTMAKLDHNPQPRKNPQTKSTKSNHDSFDPRSDPCSMVDHQAPSHDWSPIRPKKNQAEPKKKKKKKDRKRRNLHHRH